MIEDYKCYGSPRCVAKWALFVVI